jgi:O-antigen/teichoic acid export membrane protein
MTVSASPELDGSPDAPVATAGISLRASFQWALVGNVVYAACQWGILIALAKLGTTEAVGQFTLGFAVTAPVLLFANLQLGALQATDAGNEYRFGHYLALRLVTNGLALIVVAGLAFGPDYSAMTAAVVMVVGVAKAMEMFTETYHSLMMQHHHMERVAWSLMLKGVLSLAAMTASLWLGADVLGATAALAATWGLMFFAYDLRSPAWLRKVEPGCAVGSTAPCWEWKTVGKLAWLAFPLGVRLVLSTLTLYLPRYFVEHYRGLEELGIFSALAYVTVVSQVVVNALAQAAAPRLAQHYVLGDIGAYRLLVLKLTGASALVGAASVAVALIAGEPILRLLYKPAYAAHVELFVWIMAGSAVWCVVVMFIAAANAARRHASQLVGALVVVLASLAAGAILVPNYGLIGGALVSLAGAIVGVLTFGGIVLSIGKPARGAKTGAP